MLLFPKTPTTFLKCFRRGERRKYARKKVRPRRCRTHKYHVMSPTRSPLSHPGGSEAVWRANDAVGHAFIDTACATENENYTMQT